MGRGARRRTVMGCAAAGCASSAAARRTAAAGATGRPASRGALVERSTSGSSRSGVGNARRISSITHPDGAVLEPTGSCLERTRAARFGAGRTRIERLGGSSARAAGATTDHRTRMERTPGRGLGRPEDRGTRGSTCALVVRAFGTALGARSRRATVERARAGGSSRAASMVTPG
jgi:hypothetical protein